MIITIILAIIGGALVVVVGFLIIKKRASKDEVAKFYRLKGQDKQLKGGIELEEKTPLTPREPIIKKAEKEKEKEEGYVTLPVWYSPSEKVRVEENGKKKKKSGSSGWEWIIWIVIVGTIVIVALIVYLLTGIEILFWL